MAKINPIKFRPSSDKMSSWCTPFGHTESLTRDSEATHNHQEETSVNTCEFIAGEECAMSYAWAVCGVTPGRCTASFITSNDCM